MLYALYIGTTFFISIAGFPRLRKAADVLECSLFYGAVNKQTAVCFIPDNVLHVKRLSLVFHHFEYTSFNTRLIPVSLLKSHFQLP